MSLSTKPSSQPAASGFGMNALSVKLVLPSILLMLLALLGSSLFFFAGSRSTQRNILDQQARNNGTQVIQSFQNGAAEVGTAAQLLANDPAVSAALALPEARADEALTSLNQRAVVLRDRFSLDLVQVYNASGDLRTNLVLSSLFRSSNLLAQLQPGQQTLVNMDGRPVLLSRQAVAGGGDVITGMDMESELLRIKKDEFILADLGVVGVESRFATSTSLPFEPGAPNSTNQHIFQQAFQLAGEPLDLWIVNDTTALRRIMTSGFATMVISMLVTTIILTLVWALISRRIARPIQVLSKAAQALAAGDLNQQVSVSSLHLPFTSSHEDEITLLADSFNHMVVQLRNLYRDLEHRVEDRTRDLRAASEVALAANISLNLQEVLETTANLIRQHFSFYHVGFFIIEPDTGVAVLRQVSSETGETLLAHKHRLKVGSQSLVGAATAFGKPLVAQDVTRQPHYYANPFLPDTRAEAVFPLVQSGQTIGALDVQSTEPDSFSEETISLLTTLAGQIAIAVQNALLYEQQRGLTLRLSEMDRQRAVFLSNFSNELRLPINTIAEIAQRQAGSSEIIINEVKPSFHKIHKASTQLVKLVEDLRHLADMDVSESNSLKLEPVNFRELIDSVYEVASGLMRGKPISLLKALDPNLPIVQADRIRLRQAFLGMMTFMLQNAREGYVIFRASSTQLLDTVAGEMRPNIEGSLSDSNVHLSRERLASLFEPLGTGRHTNLAICRNIIEMHGGKLWAESSESEGLVISFILPTSPAPHQPAIPAGELIMESTKI